MNTHKGKTLKFIVYNINESRNPEKKEKNGFRVNACVNLDKGAPYFFLYKWQRRILILNVSQ